MSITINGKPTESTVQERNYCKYCGREIVRWQFCCRYCFSEFEEDSRYDYDDDSDYDDSEDEDEYEDDEDYEG